MGYGLTVFNEGGGMTLSSDGLIYGYIGRATYQSIVQPPGPLSGTIGWPSEGDCGYSVYTIDWPGPIIVALPVKTNGSTALLDMFQSGSTWTIHVHKGNGSTNAIGFDLQEATEVYVFGRPTTVSGFGLALYNAAGQLTGDLSRKPLTFDRFVSMAGGVTFVAFSGLTVPAVVGDAIWFESTSEPYDDTFNDNYMRRGAWRWNSTLGRLTRTLYLWFYRRSEDVLGASNVIPATSAILLEANGLT